MTNEMKLLRAFIEASGYEITELDAKPCLAQPETGKALYDGGDYKVTKRVNVKRFCTKCGTHLARNAPQNSCLCGTPYYIVTAKNE